MLPAAGNQTISEWSFTVGVAPELFDPAPENNQLLPFGSVPVLTLQYRSADAALDPASLRFYLDAEDISGQATVTASDPTQGLIAVQLTQALVPGPHDVYVEVANAAAIYNFAEWSFQVDDERLYGLTIRTPDDQAVLFEPEVAVTVAVQSNRDFPQTVLVNGERARFQSQSEGEAIYAATVTLQPGLNTLSASASFADGSSRSDLRHVTYEAPPQVSILSPVDFVTLGPALPATAGGRAIAVEGTVSRPVVGVSVNQQAAQLAADGRSFSLDPFLLHEGDNLLSVVATDTFGRTGSASVAVYVDQTAPLLGIERPSADAVTSSARIDVRGMVNDAIEGGVGAVEPLVEIVNAANQQRRTASVSDRSFLATDVPLEVGANALTVSATDARGNVGTATVSVVRIAAGSRRITVLGGNRQSGAARGELAEPLRVAVIDPAGNPVANLPLHFDVVRGNGSIARQPGQPSLADGVNPARHLQVATDASGQAQVWLRLGSQASPGGNSLRVWHPAIAEDAVFTASVDRGAAHFVLAEGIASTQYAATGSPPLQALTATVYDADYNRVMAAPVRYRVFDGQARFTAASAPAGELGADGQSIVVSADRHGVVSARPQLGDRPGTVKILAEALREDGSVTGQAMFQLIVQAARSGPTRFTGVVMDHSGAPLAGVIASIGGTALATSTDAEGRFRFDDQVPAGKIDLFLDGRQVVATPNLAYPALHFETAIIAGQDNQLPRPIYLPPIHLDRRQTVGGDQDVHFTLPGFEGFEMIVKAHSVTFPDGSRSGEISVNPVHNDRLPMVPPGGGSRFGGIAWTIQPSGTRFDPPIEIKIPNPGGMTAGQTATLVQWDHDLATFVPIGRATVSEDASQILTDPGAGITKAGWGGCTGPACPPDPGFPQCAIGNPSQCRGAQCNACKACQKEVTGGTGTCPICEVDFKATDACDDKNECTADDKCAFGGCTGTLIEVKITKSSETICVGAAKQFAAETVPPLQDVFWRTPHSGLSVSITGVIQGLVEKTSNRVEVQASACHSAVAAVNVKVISQESVVEAPGQVLTCLQNVGLCAKMKKIQNEADPKHTVPHTTFVSRNFRSLGGERSCRLFREGSQMDAATHGYLACRAHRDIGRDSAEKFLDAHEADHPEDTCEEHEMDFNNNEIGRQLANKVGDCEDLAIDALNAGQFQLNLPFPPGICTWRGQPDF